MGKQNDPAESAVGLAGSKADERGSGLIENTSDAYQRCEQRCGMVYATTKRFDPGIG